MYLGLTVLSVILLYILITVIAMRFVRGVYYFDTKRVDLIKKEFGKLGVAEKYEEYLVKNPRDKEARNRLLAWYWFGRSKEAKVEYQLMRPHILWFISNAPDFDGPWMNWGVAISMTISDPDDFSKVAIVPFKEQTEKSPKNMDILKNAGSFSKYFDQKFSFNCLKLAYESDRLDPFVIEEFAYVSSHVDESDLSLNLYLEFMDIPWSLDDHARILRVQQSAPLVYPKAFARLVLLLISVRNWRPARKDIYALKDLIQQMLEKDDYKVPNKWIEKLELALEDRSSEKAYRPTINKAYTNLVLVEAKRQEWGKVQKHLEKIVAGSNEIPISIEFWCVDEPILLELVKHGQMLLAKDFWVKRSDGHDIDSDTLDKVKGILGAL